MSDFLSESTFEILTPDEQTLPFVFNSPHSGCSYPQAFLDAIRLDRNRVRLSEDAHVDKLFDHVTDAGAPLLKAHFPRVYVDVNREPYELDPKMFVGRLPPHANIRSARVAGGLGTIPRVVTDAEEIYSAPWPVEEALDRIETLYKPYHATLRRLVAQTHVKFGCAVLVDCHSMPSTFRGQELRYRSDFVLGDRHGTSAASALVDHAANLLAGLGYRVSVNKPYAGGFITEHYGRPAKGLHALQIEVNRSLYMNEKTLELSEGFDHLRKDLSLFANRLFAIPRQVLATGIDRFAAE
ncbi:N-formylglutamate amidohydrolase [Oryzibacter oryziterrae]|uniref:N-formylglutamate amidohydrolase n=1 Tax=Oryzibacter oryziterrae TaxID=2766474 RepID=UPI0036F1FC83